jgi:hypothetical protein
MKPTQDWHKTRFGGVVLFLGSIRFAVPVLVFVAAALAYGTYLESMHDSRMSRATVYGSWWFIALMAMIAVSLTFAVITRYPWKRRHVGFITVHCGLLMLIAGGFWSLFGRLEGHLVLEEGQTSDILETDQEVLEIAEFNGGESTILATIDAPTAPGVVTVAGVEIVVREYWDNSRQEQYVADGGPRELRALEIAFDPGATTGEWVAQESRASPPNVRNGLQIRVLPDGEQWTPPSGDADASDYSFTIGRERFPLGNPGDEALPGWTIVNIERFSHALVTGGRLTESGGGESNPAITVEITDGQGTTERHTAFRNYPDMVLGRVVEGTGASNARLLASAPKVFGEQLVFFGDVGELRIGYVSTDGAGSEVEGPFALPATLEVGDRKLRVFREFARAHVTTRSVSAARSTERRPALVIEFPGSEGPTTVAYKSMSPILGDGRNLLLRYGPRVYRLPFAFTLNDFRKMDYPGTEMAMAYESDVIVALPDEEPFPYLVHMNTPFVHHPWKVYQSGFMGETISIFSVMKDPGLPLTYLASVVLCVGIYLMFFSKRFSWGHPGIPNVNPATERNSHVAHSSNRAAGSPDVVPEPVGAGVGDSVMA